MIAFAEAQQYWRGCMSYDAGCFGILALAAVIFLAE
jgi:hypothetical protein